MHLQSVLTDRVRWPSATLSIAPLYQMCGRVSHLCVAFPCHVAKVCEKFVSFEWIFLYEPCDYENCWCQRCFLRLNDLMVVYVVDLLICALIKLICCVYVPACLRFILWVDHYAQ